MGGVVAPKYSVSINGVDHTPYISTISINHEVQTLTPTFSILISKNITITGGELFDIYMGYGNTLVPMLTGGTISTYSRTLTQNGIEFIVNGRGPLAKIIDESPELDQIYIPTWDKSFMRDGYWVNSACGIQRTEQLPPGIDPNQDPDEYEIFEGDWYVHTLLKDIIESKLKLSCVLNIPDAKYRETFRINRTQTWLSGIQQLTSIWEPIIFMQGNTIYILDTDMALPQSSNIQYGPSSCVVVNTNHTKNNIINRILIKGGSDESVVPVKKETWVPDIDTITFFPGEDLSGECTELIASEHGVPSSSGEFTGSRIYKGYYKPMFGDPLYVYTRAVDYSRDRIMKVSLEVNYFRTSGSFGSDQQVCTRVFKTRRQAFVIAGYYTEEADLVYVSLGDLFIERGFSGSANTGTDAADPNGQPILDVYFGGYSYIKVFDQEVMNDTETGSISTTSMSRTFGILPLSTVTTVGGSPTPGRTYYLVGGAPVIAPFQLYKYSHIDGFTLSYRIIQEEVVSTDTRTSNMAVKQTHTFDYTKMISDYSMPVVDTTSEMVLVNQTFFLASTKKPIYQFEEYFEDLVSIDKYGYRPVVTYYDPSILNSQQATVLKNKIFAKSGRIDQEITIQPTIGNPLLSVGKSLILESSVYKQTNFAQYNINRIAYEDTTVDGGDFIINGIRHSFNKDGFKTEISLRKLWKLIT